MLSESRTPDPELLAIARRVNWYTPPEGVLNDVPRFLCQVMVRGRLDDVVIVQRRYSTEAFRNAYRNAPPGLFDARSWAYWGLILFNDNSLPLPRRFPAAHEFDWRGSAPRRVPNRDKPGMP